MAHRMALLLRRLLDRRDDRRARKLRASLGASGLIVSWHRIDPPQANSASNFWLARVSGRAWPGTVERAGRNRRQAISRAAEALAQLARGD